MGYCFNQNLLLLITVKVLIINGVHRILVEPKVPQLVKAYFGSDTNISCTVSTNIKGLKVKWYFGNTSNFEDVKMMKFPLIHSSVLHYDENLTASYLTIRNVAFTHAGWYFCEVTQDIPHLNKQQSDGSKLIVYSQSKHNLDDNRTISSTSTTFIASETLNVFPLWMWVAVAAGCTLIITTVIITAVLCRRKKEPPLYENTKDASKKHWNEAQSIHHCIISSDYSNIQMDTLKPHKYKSNH